MEHRLCPRTATPMPVVVHVRGRGRASCTTRDVSVDGMFITLDSGLFGIRERSVVEVIVEEAGSDAAHGSGTMAYVVHRRADGLGVMFTSLNSPARDAIRRMLAGQQATGTGDASPAKHRPARTPGMRAEAPAG